MNRRPGQASGFQVTRGGIRGAGDPAPAASFSLLDGIPLLSFGSEARFSQGQCYEPGRRRGSLVAAVVRLAAHPGSLLTPASSPARSPSFTPTLSEGTDLGAGLEGEDGDATVRSPQGEAGPLATRGVWGRSCP